MSYYNYEKQDGVMTETDLGHKWGSDDAEVGGGFISSGGLSTPEMKAAYAEALLGRIFANVPEGCTEVRLSVREYWDTTGQGKNRYWLTGWIYFGAGKWERITALQDQPEITQSMINDTSAGWALGRKMPKTTFEFIYPFTPHEGQHEFALHSRTADVGERRRKEELFERLAA